MKMHWGHGIATFYCFFVATLVVVVLKSTTFDNSLVARDYYLRDINYQQEYDRLQRSATLPEGPALEVAGRDCRIAFPQPLAAGVSGSLHFYRPSTAGGDRRVPLQMDDRGGMDISLEGLLPGRYRAIVTWTAGEVAYQDEFELEI